MDAAAAASHAGVDAGWCRLHLLASHIRGWTQRMCWLGDPRLMDAGSHKSYRISPCKPLCGEATLLCLGQGRSWMTSVQSIRN